MRARALGGFLALSLACGGSSDTREQQPEATAADKEEKEGERLLYAAISAAARGERTEAKSLLDRALRTAKGRGDTVLTSRIQCAQGRLQIHYDDVKGARDALAVARQGFEAPGSGSVPGWARAECLQLEGAIAYQAADYAAYEALLAKAYALVEDSPHPNADRHATVISNHALSGPGGDLALARTALEYAEKHGVAPCPELAQYRLRLATFIDRGRGGPEADELLGKAREGCGNDEDERMRQAIDEAEAFIRMQQGRHADAVRLLEPWADRTGAEARWADRIRLELLLSDALTHVGRSTKATQRLEALTAALPTDGSHDKYRHAVAVERLRVALSRGEYETVSKGLEEARALETSLGLSEDHPSSYQVRRAACLAALHLGPARAAVDACAAYDDPTLAMWDRAAPGLRAAHVEAAAGSSVPGGG